MELIRGNHNIKSHHHGCVLSIGNFDGVHLGHQQVLSLLREQAKRLSLPSTVMTFEPQPMEYFAQKAAPARLTRLRDKFVHLQEHDIDRLLCVNFNLGFADLTPDSFIEELLVKKLGVKFLVVGDDFCFGRDRKGGFSDLKRAGERYGFEVVSANTFCMPITPTSANKASPNVKRVSSTAIRQALSRSDLQQAAALLGREYSIYGRVSHGRKLGRTIGFPTANIRLKRKVSPVSGVYVVKVRLCQTAQSNHAIQWHRGVANIGLRPTVNGDDLAQLEVHIFDFEQNLYGQQLEVVLLHKLRDEIKFTSFDLLKRQIELDAQAAKDWQLEHKDKALDKTLNLR